MLAIVGTLLGVVLGAVVGYRRGVRATNERWRLSLPEWDRR